MRVLQCVVLFGLLYGGSAVRVILDKETQSNFDTIVDEILYDISKKAIDQHKDSIALPEIDETISIPVIGPLKVKGDVLLHGGTFKNISTLVRTSEAFLEENEDNSMLVKVAIGLQTLTVQYEHFHFQFLLFKRDGSFEASSVGNQLFSDVTIHRYDDGSCNVTLNKIDVVSLGKFDIDFGPDSFINRIRSKLYSWTLDFLSPIIKLIINQHVMEIAEKEIDLIGKILCEEFP